MNILLLTDWTYPCDHQFLSNVYAQNFTNRGHDITWVMRPNNEKQKETVNETWNGSDVYILPSSAYDPARNTIRFLTGRIQSNALFETGVEFSDFDLVHVRNDLPMGMVATHLADEYGMAYAHQITHLKAESMIEAAQLGFSGRSSWVKGHLGKWLRRRVANSSDAILPISDAMKEYLVQNGYDIPMQTLPTGAEVIDHIPDGECFKSKYGIKREYMLLYMGSMSPLRKLDFLFDVMKNVTSTYDTELVMAGGRSQPERERLKKEARQRNVSDYVTFTGWISDRSEIRSAVAAADIGLSPFRMDSVLRTNAPIKTLEYMSLGTPVVASATPDQVKVLTDSEAGLAVNYDTTSFVNSIKALLSSEDKRQRMSKNGRNYLESNRNFDTLTYETEEIYENILREGSSL